MVSIIHKFQLQTYYFQYQSLISPSSIETKSAVKWFASAFDQKLIEFSETGRFSTLHLQHSVQLSIPKTSTVNTHKKYSIYEAFKSVNNLQELFHFNSFDHNNLQQ